MPAANGPSVGTKSLTSANAMGDRRQSQPAKTPARIAGMFDAIAERYDLLNHLLSGGLDKRWRKRAVDVLQLSGRETVLDLCTGTADLALEAACGKRRAKRVLGIDFSPAMLQHGLQKIRRAPEGAVIDVVRGDAIQIPLKNHSVDAVTIGFGIRNVENPDAACREILRVLRPRGTLVILEFSLPRRAAIRRLYLWYFQKILPVVGRVVSRHPSAYTYLPESVEVFPTAADFSQQLRNTGFGTVRAVPLTFGIVHMFVATNDRDKDRVL
jgi:demethylmenaquinone methyltransferase/2-methoxy-6-polyprenyl-1,4-benzoquinol methylase